MKISYFTEDGSDVSQVAIIINGPKWTPCELVSAFASH